MFILSGFIISDPDCKNVTAYSVAMINIRAKTNIPFIRIFVRNNQTNIRSIPNEYLFEFFSKFLDFSDPFEDTVRVAYYQHSFIMNQAEGPNKYISIAFVINQVCLI